MQKPRAKLQDVEAKENFIEAIVQEPRAIWINARAI